MSEPEPGASPEMKRLTPESGFALVGIDYITDPRGQLFHIKHYDMYQDALNAKKDRDNPGEYLVLYRGAGGEYLHR